MTVKEYLESTFNPNSDFNVREPITCADGFWIDVQGGTRGHYCSPREHCNVYDKVELSCEEDDLISEYAEGGNSGIYQYVPISVVETLASKHGGIAI